MLQLRAAHPAFLLPALAALVAVSGIALHLTGAIKAPLSRSSAPPVADLAPPLPSPEPQTLQPVTPLEAKALNEALPFARGGIERAAAFHLGDEQPGTPGYARALDCLTAAVYYEAAGESEHGQRAIAQVVLNRVRHPAFPSTVCGVVYQGQSRASGCQFTFTCDGSLSRKPGASEWTRARRISEEALAGVVEPSVGMATHYHTLWVAPYWAPRLDKIAQIGAHIFYRWPGYWGRREAFRRPYSGETSDALSPQPTGPFPLSELANSAVPLASSISPVDPVSSAARPASRPLAEDGAAGNLLADLTAATPAADDVYTRLLVDDRRQLQTAAAEASHKTFQPTSPGCAKLELSSTCLLSAGR